MSTSISHEVVMFCYCIIALFVAPLCGSSVNCSDSFSDVISMRRNAFTCVSKHLRCFHFTERLLASIKQRRFFDSTIRIALGFVEVNTMAQRKRKLKKRKKSSTHRYHELQSDDEEFEVATGIKDDQHTVSQQTLNMFALYYQFTFLQSETVCVPQT